MRIFRMRITLLRSIIITQYLLTGMILLAGRTAGFMIQIPVMMTVISLKCCVKIHQRKCSHITEKFNIPCVIICDTAHRIEHDGTETIVVDKGADSIPFNLST